MKIQNKHFNVMFMFNVHSFDVSTNLCLLLILTLWTNI